MLRVSLCLAYLSYLLLAVHEAIQSLLYRKYFGAFICSFLLRILPLKHDPIGWLRLISNQPMLALLGPYIQITKLPRYLFFYNIIHCTIMNPLLRPPFEARNPGKLEILSLIYLWIRASLNRPKLKRAIDMKSADFATYYP